jgi:hypothetical protein
MLITIKSSNCNKNNYQKVAPMTFATNTIKPHKNPYPNNVVSIPTNTSSTALNSNQPTNKATLPPPSTRTLLHPHPPTPTTLTIPTKALWDTYPNIPYHTKELLLISKLFITWICTILNFLPILLFELVG